MATRKKAASRIVPVRRRTGPRGPRAKGRGPRSLPALRRVGPRADVIQVVPPRHVYRPRILSAEEAEDHDLVINPLQSPTGPNGAPGFHNVNNSQIATPQVLNIYMGPFWDGTTTFFEGFCKAVVENGYLDPLRDLNYGTGPGTYLGSVQGEVLKSGTVLNDSDARAKIQGMLDRGEVRADANSLLVLILPDGVVSRFDSDGSRSCDAFCGYHDAFAYQGGEIAYAILPAPTCEGCGNGQRGDFTAIYAHELAEACTDKVPGQGWVADDGQENGDLEAWIFFGWGPPSDPNRYTVQGYYTNERGNTVGAWRG